MAYNSSSTRRSSNYPPRPDSSHMAHFAPLVSQPVNMNQKYIHGQKHALDQAPTLSFYDGSFEGSQNSFPSNLSTHPPTCFPPYASDLDSGSTSELEFARAASFRTPSTPTNSSNGEFEDIFGDGSPCGYQSPSCPDRTLQGISGSNCKFTPIVGCPCTISILTDHRRRQRRWLGRRVQFKFHL